MTGTGKGAPGGAMAETRPPLPVAPILAFAALAAAASLAGLASYRRLAAEHLEEGRHDAEADALRLAVEIGAWRSDRLADATAIAAQPSLARALSSPMGERERDELVLWFEALRARQDYSGVALLDVEGEPKLALGVPLDALAGDPGCSPEAVRRALASGAPSISDVHGGPAAGPHLDLLAPLRVPGASPRPVGALLLRVDPATRLLALLVDPGGSGGPGAARLVRREGQEAVELSARGAEVRTPLSDGAAPAVRAALGEEGLLAATARRSSAAARQVRGSGWAALVEVDEARLLRDIREHGRSLAMAVAGFVAAAGGGLALWWRRRSSVWLRREARAEAERAALMGQLRELSRAANDMVFLTDETSRILEANDRAAQGLGYSPEELLRLSVRDLRDPATLGDLDSVVQHQLSQGSMLFETRYRRKDGSTFPVEVSARVLEQGGRRLVHGIVRDITERKAAEAALRESEERLALALEATADGVWDWDLERDAIYVSPRWEHMLGYQPGEIATVERARRVVHPDDRPRLEALYQEHFAGRTQQVELEMRVATGSGGWRWVLNRAKVVRRDQAGRPLRVVGAYTDVTERRALQSQLLLAERMASLGTLSAGMAHEINNPLAFTVANLGFAMEEARRLGSRSPELEQALVEAQEGAARVGDIVRDLKSFSRHDEGDGRGRADVRQVLRAAVNLAQAEIRPRASVELDLGETPPVAANERRLGQVFLNLLINAAQAIPEGTPERHAIRARTRAENGRVVVEVEDTGAGIAPEILERIFDPFFTTKPVGVGTGLGLSICHGLVTGMGGDIQVQSAPGRGSLFRVRLPAARGEAAGAEPPPPAATASRARILVVDDEPMVGRAVARILGTEHEVAAVTSGEAALSQLGAGPGFDLVLCDLMMPGLSGMDLFERVRQADPAAAARFVFLTGGAFSDRAREFLDRVPNPRLDKPFDAEALRRGVAGLLAKERGAT
ncbi:MAG TPA: PAS domain S-box protein [Anaeromyxobacteraceae bacterium]|nr:PAS domain S-box protein [Anaeromyxobacteraceae bacterium]